MYITLEEAKKQLNIDESFNYDNQYIASLIDVAESVVCKDCGINLSGYTDSDGCLEAPLRHAILLLVSHYYANREPVAFASSSEVPLTYRHLISLYRNYLN